MQTILGLTGRIGAGKSFIGKIFADLGAEVIDADTLAHTLLKKGTIEHKKVLRRFPESADAKGVVKREALAKIVFTDSTKLKTLEDILWPGVTELIQAQIAKSKSKVIVIEAIKLLQSPLKNFCDEVWVIITPKDLRLKRLVQLRKMKKIEAARRIDFQEKTLHFIIRGKVSNFLNFKAEETAAKAKAWYDSHK